MGLTRDYKHTEMITSKDFINKANKLILYIDIIYNNIIEYYANCRKILQKKELAIMFVTEFRFRHTEI